MAKSRIISKEALEAVKQQLHDQGESTLDDLIELIRPHCTFDPVTLQEQALRRLAGRIVRSMRDEMGTRTAFIIQGKGIVVDIESCSSYPKVAAVDDQLARQIDGLTRSKKKSACRRLELAGQMDLFAAQ